MKNRPTAIIVEDEPVLSDWLEQQLEILWPELDVVDKAYDGSSGLSLIEKLKPDFAFMDIRIPELSGLEVCMQSRHKCHVVFVTAYNEYAIEAFEAEAVDYLLKPVDEDRLRKTVERLKKKSKDEPSLEVVTRLVEKLISKDVEYLEWIQVSVGHEIKFISVDEVGLFTAADKMTICCTATDRYYIRTTLRDLEERLDPKRFWRVHRNSLINISKIERVRRDSFLGAVVFITGLDKAIQISQVNLKRFHGM